MTKTEKRFVAPASKGLLVPKPASQGGGYLAPEGESVVWTSFWRRRLKCGEIVEADPERAERIRAARAKKRAAAEAKQAEAKAEAETPKEETKE